VTARRGPGSGRPALPAALAGSLAAAVCLALACAGPAHPPAAPDAGRAAGAAAADPRFEAAARYSARHAGKAFLVLEGDRVVYEAGHNRHDAEEPHPLEDGSASFWGVLAVAAAEDGLLELDEPVARTLPSFAPHPWKREMRVRELLQYTSGLEAGVHALHDASVDRFARALSLEMVARPGERFQYGPSHVFVLGELMRRKLAAAGQADDPVAYLERRILAPIGLEVAEWRRDQFGGADMARGAVLTAREWAKFGRFLARGGSWQDARVVHREALASCFEGSRANRGFGLGLWLNPEGGVGPRATTRDARDAARAFAQGLPDLLVASGLHNQRLYVLPSLDLVVVRFGGRDRSFRDSELLAALVAGAATARTPTASPGS
jgi:CubicO group peptidase (beta-lactamase class C family)